MKMKIKDKNGITLKTENKFIREDIEVAVDESLLGGGGVEIPSVTNLTCDSEGNVSWTEPNFESLADYEPTISYIVSVNDNEVETSNTSVNMNKYLKNGVNVVIVKVKTIFYNNGTLENMLKTPHGVQQFLRSSDQSHDTNILP